MSASLPAAKRRSFWLKLFLAVLVILCLSGWARLYEALRDWDLFITIGMQPGPGYLAVTGALIGAGFLPAIVGIWLRRRWSWAFARILVLAWAAWDWIDRLWISRAETRLVNWPFALGLTLAILVLAFLVYGKEAKKNES